MPSETTVDFLAPGNVVQFGSRRAAGIPDRRTPEVHTPLVLPHHFKDGLKVVGSEVAPGTYRCNGGSTCYWERLSGLHRTLDEIIANGNASGPDVITIADHDVAFYSSRCGEWTDDLSPITLDRNAPFTDGTYIVGVDIAPGLWRAEHFGACYWERLSGFTGSLHEIIATSGTEPNPIVRIAESDRGFRSSHCGIWTRIA